MGVGSIKPEVLAIREFFKEEAKSLRIPSIQRQFVWEPDDIKDLIDSIVSGYPIGAVIIWEPSSKFPSAPLAGKDTKANSHRYVLDGQQRLTALMLIQNAWTMLRGPKKISTSRISYVPDNNRFYLSAKKGIDLSLIVNATLGDADALDQLRERYPGTYKKAIDNIGERIVNYKLPFYVLRSDGADDESVYEKIAEIFTRVNSAGVKIGNLEMFLSFFAAAFPKEQKDRIILMHEEFSDRSELDLEPLVRFIFFEMGLTQNQITKSVSFRKSIQTLKEKYTDHKRSISTLLDRSRRAIATVMDLLAAEFGASTTQYLPSQIALVPLFSWAYKKDYTSVAAISPADRRGMLRWFLIASFNATYSTSTNKKLEDDLTILHSERNDFPVDSLLSTMKARKPYRDTIARSDVTEAYWSVLRGRAGREYLMLLGVLLHRAGATDWEGRPLSTEHTHAHHIFPREFLKDSGETREEYINCLANVTFVAPAVNIEVGDAPPSDYLTEIDPDVLEQHLIPAQKRLWAHGAFEEFLEARFRLIWKETSSLLDELSASNRSAKAGK